MGAMIIPACRNASSEAILAVAFRLRKTSRFRRMLLIRSRPAHGLSGFASCAAALMPAGRISTTVDPSNRLGMRRASRRDASSSRADAALPAPGPVCSDLRIPLAAPIRLRYRLSFEAIWRGAKHHWSS